MIIPDSTTFDQRTMTLLLEHDPLVQRSRAFFALFDWSVVLEPAIDPSQPGKRPHPQSAYVKAFLLKIEEGFSSCTQVRRFLLEHPLLVLEPGFRPLLNWTEPYGFDVAHTIPTALVAPQTTGSASIGAVRPVGRNCARFARGDPWLRGGGGLRCDPYRCLDP